MYRFRAAPDGAFRHRARLLGSGPILNEVLKAQAILAGRYGVGADVWSVTSYKELRRDAMEAERWSLLHPDQAPRVPYVTRCLADAGGPVVAASDFVKALPDLVARWVPGPFASLGTEGYGRSDGREALRDFFEVDARYVTLATLQRLAVTGALPPAEVARAARDLGIDPEKPDPMSA
jgi:pyruvate dehydrogenase E1 component